MINSYLEGALVRVATYEGLVSNPTGGFLDDTGALADPTVVTLTYQVSSTDVPTVVTYPSAPIIRDGVGLYRADLDTTGQPGEWTYAWQGTGTIQAIAQKVFEVTPTL